MPVKRSILAGSVSSEHAADSTNESPKKAIFGPAGAYSRRPRSHARCLVATSAYVRSSDVAQFLIRHQARRPIAIELDPGFTGRVLTLSRKRPSLRRRKQKAIDPQLIERPRVVLRVLGREVERAVKQRQSQQAFGRRERNHDRRNGRCPFPAMQAILVDVRTHDAAMCRRLPFTLQDCRRITCA